MSRILAEAFDTRRNAIGLLRGRMMFAVDLSCSDAGQQPDASRRTTVILHLTTGQTTTYAQLPSQFEDNDIITSVAASGLEPIVTGVEIRSVT